MLDLDNARLQQLSFDYAAQSVCSNALMKQLEDATLATFASKQYLDYLVCVAAAFMANWLRQLFIPQYCTVLFATLYQ